MDRKKLVLKSETISELTIGELTGAVVGASGPSCVGITCPILVCASQRYCSDLTNTC